MKDYIETKATDSNQKLEIAESHFNKLDQSFMKLKF